MLQWLYDHKWQIVTVLLLVGVAAALWAWIEDRHSAELAVLRNELARNEQELQTASQQVEELRAQLGRKQEEISQLQRTNDRRIQEVTSNAYKQARALGDDDLLAAYNRLITGARQRNADRERTDSGD
ncbi:hypothetical protein [Cloacibacillus porcorum]|uniref:Uncharacterized protein n=1 Tax=Cloacibacillus porcorum TaxID=1197717 RepID=A0A1B2I632_9BACT|nr:hypothetical protein [Cloacibacillus porcorum]ANZ45432.1 hypothetical protein BED41_10365 [Cloacibacillus porcorum]